MSLETMNGLQLLYRTWRAVAWSSRDSGIYTQQAAHPSMCLPGIQLTAWLVIMLPRCHVGGKSLVAEVLMLARIHKAQQAMPRQNSRRTRQQAQPRGLLVLPYLSIVAEKASHLSVLLEDMKWRVQGYRGETEGQPLSNKVLSYRSCSSRQDNMTLELCCISISSEHRMVFCKLQHTLLAYSLQIGCVACIPLHVSCALCLAAKSMVGKW